MKKYKPDFVKFKDEIPITETTDTNHANNINAAAKQLIENDIYLNSKLQNLETKAFLWQTIKGFGNGATAKIYQAGNMICIQIKGYIHDTGAYKNRLFFEFSEDIPAPLFNIEAIAFIGAAYELSIKAGSRKVYITSHIAGSGKPMDTEFGYPVYVTAPMIPDGNEEEF